MIKGIHRWRIWCIDEQKWLYVISSSAPTTCPTDALHNVDVDSAVIIDKEIQKLDGSPENLTLAEYKKFKLEDIDNRTGELIALGYSYGGQTFSMSANAQINITNTYLSRALLTYPVSFNSIDDTATYDVVDATDMENLYLTALNFKKGHLDSGTVLKDQVRAAIDKTGVDSVIDNR